ncbi:PfkB family carbohydrate kinase [Arcobacter sp. FWKO B]|uniref:PfkB family carbohydrate kinase n=1 Tax=Arcobacter sp. FWKO B TaxID=2593672 RepID=UPI0018A37902|nr:PfkB family carbohydrate kinase [Arcobacter sp. FWKO B]QOG12084.1 adenylyltransferase/cytidyltransferase family protein [Arcobacter sp. FWKO B]
MTLIKQIKKEADGKKIAFVSGNFNILHPGHLRFLKFAKESSDFLVVGVNQEDKNVKLLDANIRLESVNHSMYVDYAFILQDEPIDFIARLKPEIVVKGSEHEDKVNSEKELIESYGGKLIFSSGDIKFSSLSLLQDEINQLEHTAIKKPLSYLNRHQIDYNKLLSTLEKFKDLNVLVIGDVIVDEYITCEPLGMSQEDPTIVVSPISSNIFLGGAGIVAAHSAGLGANVDFISIIGNDNYANLVEDKLKEYKVNAYLYSDNSRPTTLKQRFRANSKTLLRVNHLKQHHMSKEMQDQIFNDLEKVIKNKDLIVFSDFSYGCLPISLIEKITNLGKENNIMMVADSQSSSQTGDISKFKGMTLVTPTEREARLGVNDFESGLIVLAEKLRSKSDIKNIFITLGSEGILIHSENDSEEKSEKWITDQIKALNSAPKDVAGAGDSLLISSSMAIASGASVIEAAYIGSIAAACQVGRVGNIPLNIDELNKELRQ